MCNSVEVSSASTNIHEIYNETYEKRDLANIQHVATRRKRVTKHAQHVAPNNTDRMRDFTERKKLFEAIFFFCLILSRT